MSEDHIAVAINGVLYVKFEDAKKLREGWDKADAEIEKLREALRTAKDLYLHGSTTSAFIEICAALGEKK
jgi:predicted translin family RNA/ssDNA-binding protein